MKRYFYPHQFALNPADTADMRAKSLEDAFELFAVINQGLSKAGPYHLQSRFSLVDLILAFWVSFISHSFPFERFSAIADCVQRVVERPRLNALFDSLVEQRDAYLILQSRNQGVD